MLSDIITYSLVALASLWALAVLLGVFLKVTGNIKSPAASENESYEQRMRNKALERQRNLDESSSHGALLAVYLGGANIRMIEGSAVFLSTIDDNFIISHAVANQDVNIPIKDIRTVEISGPGTQTSNAGLIGGGFGLEGAAKGIIAATLINAATSKTTTNTFLRLATNYSEAIFHFNDQEPAKLRLTLSPLFVAADSNNREGASTSYSLADELLKLQSLKEYGSLSAEEFDNAKRKILSEPKGSPISQPVSSE